MGKVIGMPLAAAVLAATGMMTYSASAQTPTATAQQQPQRTYVLSGLTIAEMQLIGKALSAMPYAEVAPLLQKLQVQISAQENPPKAGESGGQGKGESGK